MSASWSLVSTMLGAPEALLPCIAHHLQSDAEHLYIYLDAPDPIIDAALADHPRCIVTVCDAAYWADSPGGRPAGVVPRQKANLENARRRSTSHWLVHVDSDEFLVTEEAQSRLVLGQQLADVPPDHDWVRILPMERVVVADQNPQTIFDGVFRSQTPDAALIEAAYGPGAAFLHRGLSGHVRGKIGFRRETEFEVRLHDLVVPTPAQRPRRKLQSSAKLVPCTELPNVRLLHFEGWSPLHWASKLVRFAEAGRLDRHQRGRRAAVRFMCDHEAPADRLSLFDKVQCLSPEGLALLDAAGLIRNTPFDPVALTRATFPGVELDFSIQSFDDRIRALSPSVYQRSGL